MKLRNTHKCYKKYTELTFYKVSHSQRFYLLYNVTPS